MSINYWNKRYINNETGWDLGGISPPLKEYIDQLTDKKLKVLIPGAGNAHEAEYLFKNGFSNVSVIDISSEALKNFENRCPFFPKDRILSGDFFSLVGEYDLILEQTFFCALQPSLRKSYVQKMHELLKESGKLVGLFFNRHFDGGPPYGGNIREYEDLFAKYFQSVKFQECTNSIAPRKGFEVFAIIRGKK